MSVPHSSEPAAIRLFPNGEGKRENNKVSFLPSPPPHCRCSPGLTFRGRPESSSAWLKSCVRICQRDGDRRRQGQEAEHARGRQPAPWRRPHPGPSLRGNRLNTPPPTPRLSEGRGDFLPESMLTSLHRDAWRGAPVLIRSLSEN